MMNDIEIWLERLSSLYKSQMRQAASMEGVQMVHLEILQFLSISNKYSNTAQALTEYLGQTKGSISQSLKLLEKSNYIERSPSARDKRIVHIYLTALGKESLERMVKYYMPKLDGGTQEVDAIRSLLQKWQFQTGRKGFGQCQSCRFNKVLEDETFECALTNEVLSATDLKKICKEHEFILLDS